MGQHTAAVNTFPFKSITRQFIKFIPADLRSHKIRKSALLHNLRQRCRITKYIRQPKNRVVHAELFLEKSLSMDKLTHQRFTGSNITVGFHEHSAFRLPSALFYPLFDLFINLRSIFLHVFVKLRLTGHKYIFWILSHQLQHGRKAAHCFIFRYPQCPKPCTVDMRMSYTIHDRTLLSIAMLFVKFFCNIFLRFLHTGIVFWRSLFSHIQKIQRFVDRLNNGDICLIILRKKTSSLIRHFQIVIILLGFPIQHFQHGIQLQTKVLIACKCGQHDTIRLTCLRFFSQNHFSVIDIQSLTEHTVHKNRKLRICRIPIPFFSGKQFIHYTLSVKLLWNRHESLKPVILPMTAPDLLMRKILPGRGIQMRHILKSFVRADHFIIFDLHFLRIDLVFQIFQHFPDSFFK